MGSPIGQRFQDDHSSKTRAAKCEKCQTDYVYRIDATRPDLKGGVPGVVPCPQCGWVQQGMAKVSGAKRAIQLFCVLAAVTVPAGFFVGKVVYAGAGLGLSMATGLATFFLHNPNSKHDKGETAPTSAIPLPELDQGQGITDEALQRELFSCLRKAMLSMAGIDGHIDPSEMMAISRLYLEHTDEKVDTATLEHEAKRAMGQHDRMLNGLHCLAPYLTSDDKTQFLKAAAVVAAADGRIDPAEKKLMHSISAILDVPIAETDCLLSNLAVPA